MRIFPIRHRGPSLLSWDLSCRLSQQVRKSTEPMTLPGLGGNGRGAYHGFIIFCSFWYRLQRETYVSQVWKNTTKPSRLWQQQSREQHKSQSFYNKHPIKRPEPKEVRSPTLDQSDSALCKVRHRLGSLSMPSRNSWRSGFLQTWCVTAKLRRDDNETEFAHFKKQKPPCKYVTGALEEMPYAKQTKISKICTESTCFQWLWDSRCSLEIQQGWIHLPGTDC